MIGAATARPQDIRHDKIRPEEAPARVITGPDRPQRLMTRKPLILYGGRLGEWAKTLAGESCAFGKVKRVADDHLLVRDETGNDRRLAEPPLLLLGIVGFDRNEFDLMTRAASWLQRISAAPDAFLAQAEDAPALAAYLLGNFQGILAAQAGSNTALARQLALARQENEDLQNRFAALESFIDRQGLQPFECAFINPPAGDEPGLADQGTASPVPNVLEMATGGIISQILPVASLGVSAIALHVARAQPHSDATLNLALQSIEDGRLIEHWSVTAGDLPVGWTTLALRHAISGLRRTLRLSIAVEGDRTSLPALSLGGAQPLDLFRLQDVELQQSIAASSLAMRIFVGLPGVAPPSPDGVAPQSRNGQGGQGGGLLERPLPADLLRGVQQARLDADASPFEGVAYLDGERIVSCHPPAFGMTIARLPQGCPAGTLRLSANLLVDHAQSRDVEFALLATDDEGRVIPLLSAVTEPMAGEGFSGWVRVPAKQPRFASLFMAGDETARDLYLATRMVEPGNHDFAWARFLNLHALQQG